MFLLLLLVNACQEDLPDDRQVEETLRPTANQSPSPSPAVSDTPIPTTMPTLVPTAEPVLFDAQFEPAECQFSPSNVSNLSCGYVTVPENRQVENGRNIRLHVAIASSYAAVPEEVPLIVLSGGPGSFALEWLYGNLHYYTDILKKRDVVFFDPRGVGYSEPSLDCPEVSETFGELLDQPLDQGELADRLVDAHLSCRERLETDNIDVASYNSTEMAADVDDIRRSLDYEKINLLGISYGTRTALTLMRDYPEILRGVVLDSPVPLEANLIGADAENSDQARQLLFEHCEADADCSAKYPELDEALDSLYRQLEENPVTIPVTHLGTGDIYQVRVDGSMLGASILEALYNSETIVTLPKLIYDSLEGENSDFETLATSLEIYLLYGDYSSEGLRYSVLCSDEASFNTLDSSRALTETAHPAISSYISNDVEMFYRICDGWGADEAEPIENQAVISDIPALVLSGELDPVTPPAWGRQVANNLSNSFFVQFPFSGHSVFAERSCARDIIGDFLDDPMTEPDSGCTESIHLNFITY
jgi:pimeloyl-ACP methyl ester carboxylesterase